MIYRIIIPVLLLIQIGEQSSYVKDKRIQYDVGKCVIKEFIEIIKKDERYHDVHKLYFMIYTNQKSYSLLLSRHLSGNSQIEELISSSSRFVKLGENEIPVIFDYDLIFRNPSSAVNNERNQDIDITLQAGYLVEFSKNNYCDILSVSYSK